jgi:predicted dehydrogenase
MILRIGIVGNGLIVRHCLTALRHVRDAHCEAIQVRPGKLAEAQALAAEHEIARIYLDYDDLLQDSNVDAVYIGIVNNMHYPYARKALEAGKHVICEKPFTSNAAQLRHLATLAEARGLFLLEAVTMMHSPHFLAIKAQLDKLGTLRLVQCNYSRYSSRYYTPYLRGEVVPAFDPLMSGGALYDINIYNLHFVAGLFGRPRSVIYHANKGFNGIDTSGVVLMEYENMQAVCVGTKDSNSPCASLVQGEKGWMRIKGSASDGESLESCLEGVIREENLDRDPHYMVAELRNFARVILEQDRTACAAWLEQSLLVMDIAEEARRSAGIVFGDDAEGVR